MKNRCYLIPISRRPSGDILNLALFCYRGRQPGPRVWIQAATHPSEVQGIGVLHALMEAMEGVSADHFRGELVLLPRANPRGLDIKVGEHTPSPMSLADGRNYNRGYQRLVCWDETTRNAADEVNITVFVAESGHLPWPQIVAAFRDRLLRTLRRRRRLQPHGPDPYDRQARWIQSRCLRADRVLDLHTSTRGTYFAYVPERPEYAEELAQLQLPYGLAMDESFAGALDESINQPWLMLHRALVTAGHQPGMLPGAMTLELGGQETYDPEAAADQASSIVRYLGFLGMIEGTTSQPGPRPLILSQDRFRSLCAPHSGLVAFRAAPGQLVRSGEELARFLVWDNQTKPSRQLSFHAPWDGIVLAHYPSAVVHAGTPIYRMLQTDMEETRS